MRAALVEALGVPFDKLRAQSGRAQGTWSTSSGRIVDELRAHGPASECAAPL